jgi:hypothetical protein
MALLPTLRVVRLDIPYLYEHATRAGCKRSHTEPLRCVPDSPATPRRYRYLNRITGACMQRGRLLAAEHSSEALPAFRHSSGSNCPLRGS